jgi:hypothetical protein
LRDQELQEVMWPDPWLRISSDAMKGCSISDWKLSRE